MRPMVAMREKITIISGSRTPEILRKIIKRNNTIVTTATAIKVAMSLNMETFI